MDKYDDAVSYLTANPGQIEKAWFLPFDNPGGELFKFVSPDGHSQGKYGCLTSIKLGSEACTPELTEAIRADERIPRRPHLITSADLPVFAEWQRKIDAALGRAP